MQNTITNLQKAAAAFRRAITLKEEAATLAADHPKVAAMIEAAARSLIAEGKKLEAGQ
jgi:hypothetical protein